MGSRQHASGGAVPTQRKALTWKKHINKVIVKAAESNDPLALLATIEEHFEDMNAINLVTGFHRIAKMCVHNSPKDNEYILSNVTFQQLFRALESRIVNHGLRNASGVVGRSTSAEDMPVQCMSVVVWSCATLRLRAEAMFGAINEVAAPRMHEFQPYELSQLIHAFAKMGFSFQEVFRGAETRLLRRRPGEFKTVCLSTLAWSFAVVGVTAPELFQGISLEIARNPAALKAQDMANTLYAFAKAELACPALFDALGNCLLSDDRLAALRPQELANALWAFAAVGHLHPGFFQEARFSVLQKRRSLTPQHIANICFAYARTRADQAEALISGLLSTSAGKLQAFRPEDLAQLLMVLMEARLLNNRDFLSLLSATRSRRLMMSTLDMLSPRTLAGVTLSFISQVGAGGDAAGAGANSATDLQSLESLLMDLSHALRTRAKDMDAQTLQELLFTALGATAWRSQQVPQLDGALPAIIHHASGELGSRAKLLDESARQTLRQTLKRMLGNLDSSLVSPIRTLIRVLDREGTKYASGASTLTASTTCPSEQAMMTCLSDGCLPSCYSPTQEFKASAISPQEEQGLAPCSGYGAYQQSRILTPAPCYVAPTVQASPTSSFEEVAPYSPQSLSPTAAEIDVTGRRSGLQSMPAEAHRGTLREYLSYMRSQGLSVASSQAATIISSALKAFQDQKLLQQWGPAISLCCMNPDIIQVSFTLRGAATFAPSGIDLAKAGSSQGNLLPHEVATLASDDPWSAMAYRAGLLLCYMLGHNDHLSWHVFCAAAAAGRDVTETVGRCPQLMRKLMAQCLRMDGAVPPPFNVVETTLQVLSLELF